MATKILINGKSTSIPGVYTRIKSGINNPSLQLSYGNLAIIDTGLGAGYAGGAGVNGQSYQGSDSVYSFTTLQDFRDFVRGGEYWKLAENLFIPSGSNPGASKVFFIKAAQTAPASLSLELGNNTLQFTTKDEGTVANGVVNSTSNELVKGYGVKMSASPFNSGFFKLSFYLGSFKGLDVQGGSLGSIPWDGVTEVESTPELLFSSPEFKTVKSFKDWANSSSDFTSMFNLQTVGVNLEEIVVQNDFTAVGTGYKLFAGGIETYNTTSYDRVLDEISELDNTFFLAPDFGDDALSTNNSKLFFHILQQARFEKFMFIGGGLTKNDFKTSTVNSVAISQAYNSDRVIVIHGGYREISPYVKDYVVRNSFFKAASILGRTCGLPPQVPLTFKTFNWSSELHNLTKDEKEYALDKGLLCTVRDTELGYVCLQGVNTLQKNNYLVNEDASSHSIAVKRIVSQLNKEITINAKMRFFSSENGFNRGTATPEDIKAWLFGFLQQRVASSQSDNLIITFRDIEVSLVGDCYHINYKFIPNFEVNKMIFTGLILEN